MDTRISVASLIEQKGKILLVKEKQDHKIVYNQPVGWLEPGEALIAGAVREAKEETGYSTKPVYLLGIYDWIIPKKFHTVRFCFISQVLGPPSQIQDPDIIKASWFSPPELKKIKTQFRNPLVQTCIDDYFKGQKFPLNIVKSIQ